MSETAKQRFFRLLGLYQAGRWAEADGALKTALRTAPKDPNLLHLAAQVAEALKDKGRAATLYRRALAAMPGWPEATFNLARLLGTMGEAEQRKEAIALLTRLSQTDAGWPQIWEALARFEEQAGLLAEAADHWRELTRRAPGHPTARANLALCLRRLCDWRDGLQADVSFPPYAATVLSDDPALQKEAAERFASEHFARLSPMPAPPAYGHERLRIGYLSSDFHAHATSYLMAELFALHDRAAFEIFVYSYGVEDRSPIRERLRREAEHFIELNALTPQGCAERIRADEIDILVDLKGHTQGGRLDILAYRPAPFQLHWLGFPGTTGASFVDFFVGDEVTIPPGGEAFFTEKVLRLPHCYQINDRQKAIAPAKAKSAYGLPEDAFVFASFNQTYKITPQIFDIWCEILGETPGSVLWLYESNRFAPDHLRREAQARGIDPARLFFAPPAPLAEHLARYRVVDLALDTFPVGGHTTTSDALWAGAPVVSLAGRSFVSRVAASLLHAVDLSVLATTTPEAYKAKILALAADPKEREGLRVHLETQRETLPLFDTPRFVKDWETLLKSLASPS